jgi:hypothetical protein
MKQKLQAACRAFLCQHAASKHKNASIYAYWHIRVHQNSWFENSRSRLNRHGRQEAHTASSSIVIQMEALLLSCDVIWDGTLCFEV